MFNRATETSTDLTGIDTVAEAHANFKRAVTCPSPTAAPAVGSHLIGPKSVTAIAAKKAWRTAVQAAC